MEIEKTDVLRKMKRRGYDTDAITEVAPREDFEKFGPEND